MNGYPVLFFSGSLHGRTALLLPDMERFCARMHTGLVLVDTRVLLFDIVVCWERKTDGGGGGGRFIPLHSVVP